MLELLARCDELLEFPIASTQLSELINNGKYEFVSYEIDDILQNDDVEGDAIC